MAKKTRFLSRPLIFIIFISICGTAVFGLIWLNGALEVRYQAIGVVADEKDTPLEAVEAILLLSPPPSGSELDLLFRRYGGLDKNRQIGKGPIVGLSGPKGVFLVRATRRTGAARAIRMGLDSGGKPPFELAWLVLRKKNYQDTVATLSILNWHTASNDWGKFANRLPKVILKKKQEQ